MEATNDQSAGLLHHMLPPRLEDAGIEDCALPPDSIKEAFLKAATAVKSRATAIFASDEDEDDCVNDPWPELKDRGGDMAGVKPEARSPGPCGGSKGGEVEAGGDDVVVVGGGEEEKKKDEVIVGGGDVRNGGDRGCVDGLAGLEIGEKKKIDGEVDDGDEEDEEEKGGEGPILVGGYV